MGLLEKLRFPTHFQAAFLAVLGDQADIGWLDADTKELHQVLMLHLFHLS